MKNIVFQPKIIVPILYSAGLLLMVLYVWNEQVVVRQGGGTPLYRNLMKEPAWIRRGFDPVDIQQAPGPSSAWSRFESPPLRVMGSPLPDLPKRTWLSPFGKPAEEFTILIQIDLGPETMDFLDRNGSVVPGLFFAMIGENWEIFVNGTMVRSEMHLDKNGQITSRRTWRDVSFAIDKALLVQGTNILALHIVGDPAYDCTGMYYASPYYLDDYRNIEGRRSNFFMITLYGVFAFTGVYHIMLFLAVKRRQEVFNLYYGISSLLICLYSIARGSQINYLFPNSDIAIRLEYATLFMMVPFLGLFVEALGRQKTTKVTVFFFWFYAFLSLTQVFFCSQFGEDVLQIWSLTVLLYFSFAFFYDILFFWIQQRRLKNKKEADGVPSPEDLIFNILIGSVVVYGCGIFDILDVLFFHNSFSLFRYGTLVYTVGIAFTLSGRFSGMYNWLESSNTRLEATVHQRTLELEEQTMIALQSSRAKSEFLATMSHEIRTPLNAVIGLAEIELRGALSAKTRNNVEQIYQSGSSLLGIVNDILDISKIEADAFELVPVEYETASLINDTVNLNRVRIGSKPITFTLELGGDFPGKLRGDELRVKQVLNNILSNAIKYTREGTVTLSAAWKKRGKEALLRFTVTDTGIGIRKEDAGKLFSSYAQLDSTANRKIEGTGLGLAITKKLVEMMKGTISVESEYGKGSVFTVELVQGLVDSVSLGEEIAEALRSFRYAEDGRDRDIDRSWMPYGKALVVDDMPVNLQVARGLLEPYGLDVDTAGSGQEAIELVQNEKAPPYDIVFMDHMMPGMDGIQAVSIIRAWEQEGEDTQKQPRFGGIPIIALTANALAGNMEMFLSKGFNGFISKPIDILQLDAVLNKWVRDKQSEETLRQAEAEKALNKGQKAEGSNGEGGSAENAGAVPLIPGVDTVAGLAMTGGSLAGYRRVLALFRKDAGERMPLLQKTPAEGELLLFTTQVHALKSAAATIGATNISAEAARLEAAGRAGDLALIAANLPSFAERLAALIDSIAAVVEVPAELPPGSPAPLPFSLLDELEKALSSRQAGDIDRILEELNQQVVDGKTREIFDDISDHVLMADFDQAAALVQNLGGKKI